MSPREDDPISALGHLRVVELAGPESRYCGKVLADLGADVIKVEPPGGDQSRHFAPFAGDEPDRERSLNFANFDANKRSVVLDLAAPDGRDEARRLADSADMLIESFAPGYVDDLDLGFESLVRNNPGLIVISVSPFGRTGPYRDYLGGDLVAQAMGGLMYVQGDDTRPPCAAPSDQASQLTGLHAAYGALAALRHRSVTGQGQHVDVSMHEVVAHMMLSIPRYAYFGEIVRRTGTASPVAPNGYYKCSDGYACVSVFFDDHWLRMVEWMGLDALDDPIWHDGDFRRANPDLIDDMVAEFARSQTVREIVDEGQRRHIVVSAMHSLEEVVDGPQLRERDYFVQVDHPRIGRHRYPGAPYRLSRTPWRVRRPAPLLGQHQDEVLGDRKATADRPKPFEGQARRSGGGSSEAPLRGVRIVDFSRVWAGPFGTRYLADLGAEVIKIESSGYLDTLRTSKQSAPLYTEINRSKLGITVNFRDPRGQALVKRLVEVTDVVMENFSAGVMERRGLGYDELSKANPGVIMVSMPGFGSTGPIASHLSYGQSLMAYSGLAVLWGYPDSSYEARPKVHYPDFISAASASTAIVAAIEHRARTGVGQRIEVPQAESVISSMGVAVLDYTVNGRSQQPMGNRSPNTAPQGCYPCRGDDQWCVISCGSDDQWSRLREVIGDPGCTQDPRFDATASRLEYQDELDEGIAEWTRHYTPYQVMRMLQKHGVPAGVVQSSEQLYQDYHLRSRGFIVESQNAEWGRLENSGVVVGLSASPGRIDRGMPGVGEHNTYVFSELLGLSSDEVAQLSEEGVMR